jgi:hypothetical protein
MKLASDLHNAPSPSHFPVDMPLVVVLSFRAAYLAV